MTAAYTLKRSVNIIQNSIACAGCCGRTYNRVATKLSDAQWQQLLETTDNITWQCSACLVSAKTKAPSLKSNTRWLLIFAAMCIACVVAPILAMYFKDRKCNIASIREAKELEQAEISDMLVTHGDWLYWLPRLKTPAKPLIPLRLPVERVVLMPTQTEPCFDNDCKSSVNMLYSSHCNQGYDDIMFNFILGNNGKMYVGRGWEYEAGDPNCCGSLNDTISVGYMGCFGAHVPTMQELKALYLLLKQGLQRDILSADYKIYSASLLFPDYKLASWNLLANIEMQLKRWPHYSVHEEQMDDEE